MPQHKRGPRRQRELGRRRNKQCCGGWLWGTPQHKQRRRAATGFLASCNFLCHFMLEILVDCMLEIKTLSEVTASGEGLALSTQIVRGDTCEHTPDHCSQHSLQQGVREALEQEGNCPPKFAVGAVNDTACMPTIKLYAKGAVAGSRRDCTRPDKVVSAEGVGARQRALGSKLNRGFSKGQNARTKGKRNEVGRGGRRGGGARLHTHRRGYQRRGGGSEAEGV